MVEELIKLWREGSSAGVICQKIPGVSRCAVIGQVDRLRKKGVEMGRRKPGLTDLQRETRVAKVRPQPRKAMTETAQLKRIMAKPIPLPAQVTEAPSAAHRCSILELDYGRCKWPLGDPRDTDFGYCGGRSLTGKVYCGYHTGLAYTSPEQRAEEQRRRKAETDRARREIEKKARAA